MTNREVMQMALDTLLTLHKSNNKYAETVAALREALIQPEPEPVALRWRVYHQNGGYTEHLCTDIVEAQGYDESYLVRGSIDPLYLAPAIPEGYDLVPKDWIDPRYYELLDDVSTGKET